MTIDSVESLRALYPEPSDRAVRKQLASLDEHCLAFIALSPFVVVSSGSAAGAFDSSPRGGEPGFVQAPDEGTLLLPDSPGNNRLDTLTNVIETGHVGLLFFIPGVDETLRVNGPARLSAETDLLARFAGARNPPRIILEVKVAEAYLHCAKALMRSRLWSPESLVERDRLPTMGQMLKDHLGSDGDPETHDAMLVRYRQDL